MFYKTLASDQNLPGNLPAYTSDMIDWTYPNIILYVTTGRIDTDLLKLAVEGIEDGSGALVVPGEYTLIPIDRISVDAALRIDFT